MLVRVVLGAFASFVFSGCTPMLAAKPFNPATAVYTPPGAMPQAAPPALPRPRNIAESLKFNQIKQGQDRAQQIQQERERARLANAPATEGWVIPKIQAGPQSVTTLGPGGNIRTVHAVQQTIAWACFARFRPDSLALLQRVEGLRPTNLIEVVPQMYQRSILSRRDPTTVQSIYPQPREEVDTVVISTTTYVATLMSMPGAGQREYQLAQQLIGKALNRINGKYPDDRLLCMQSVLAEQFGGASEAATENSLLDILRYGTQNGGLSSTCFIGSELARRQAARGNYSNALQRLEGLHSPAIGTQAGQPRKEDLNRDFGCQYAKWMQGGFYWAGVTGQRNKQQALNSYQFCSRTLDRCALNVLLITADEVKTPAQRHAYIQKLMGLQKSRDRDVASTASQILGAFGTVERELAVIPLGVIQSLAGMVTVVTELKAFCVKQYGKDACERGSASVSVNPNDGLVEKGFIRVDLVKELQDDFDRINEGQMF
ncbi:MAG: hypothetical protein QM740_21430 [Acidovorax sp.]